MKKKQKKYFCMAMIGLSKCSQLYFLDKLKDLQKEEKKAKTDKYSSDVE